MKKGWSVIGIIFLLVPWLLIGCGISQESYDTVVAQFNTAQQEIQSVKTQLESSQSKVSELTSNLAKSQTELQSSKADLELTKSKVFELTSNLEKNRDDLQLAQTNLKSTQDELDSTEEKLASIEKVYPPRQFSSSTELIEWLLTNDKSEKPFRVGAEGLYSLALELQEDALNDGYIISVDVDPGENANEFYIACVTCINGELWAWSPYSDEITEVSTILGWAKIP